MDTLNPRIFFITSWGTDEPIFAAGAAPYISMIIEQSGCSHALLLSEEKNDISPLKVRSNIAALSSRLERRLNCVFPIKHRKVGLLKLFFMIFHVTLGVFHVASRRITHVHCFGPTAGAFGFMLSKITGVKLILDSFEPHAESMVENGTWNKSGWPFKLLFYFEAVQAKYADSALGVAERMPDYCSAKYQLHLNRFFHRPCCVQTSSFSFNSEGRVRVRRNLNIVDCIVVIYVGKIGGIYLEREIFDFFSACQDFFGDKFRAIILSAETEQLVTGLARMTGFPVDNLRLLCVPHSDVPKYLSAADFAFCGVKPVPSKRYCCPIKNGEYLASGLPIVIPGNVGDDSDIVLNTFSGAVLGDFSREGYVAALKTISEILSEPEASRRARIESVAFRYRDFRVASAAYRRVYSVA